VVTVGQLLQLPLGDEVGARHPLGRRSIARRSAASPMYSTCAVPATITAPTTGDMIGVVPATALACRSEPRVTAALSSAVPSEPCAAP
jgi:hypothetical protein